MADGEGGGFTGLFKEHPLIMAVSVVAVALIAYLASRSSGGGSGAGVAVVPNPAADPNAGTNAANIAQANIAAGVANIATAGNLIGAEGSTAGNLRGSLAETEAGRQVGLTSLEASLEASEHADNTQVTIAQIASASQLEAARITAAAQSAAWGATNGAVNNTPVINNNGGSGVPAAIPYFGAHPPAPIGAGASIFNAAGLPVGSTMTADANTQAAAEGSANVFGITGADIKNAWKRAAAYFGI